MLAASVASLEGKNLGGAMPIELLEAGDLEMKRDRAEANRVAYVAATRARDLLVVQPAMTRLGITVRRYPQAFFDSIAPSRTSNFVRYGGNPLSKLRAACRSAVAKPSVNRS